MGEINELIKDRNAVQSGVCGNAEQQLRDYLENTKISGEYSQLHHLQ